MQERLGLLQSGHTDEGTMLQSNWMRQNKLSKINFKCWEILDRSGNIKVASVKTSLGQFSLANALHSIDELVMAMTAMISCSINNRNGSPSLQGYMWCSSLHKPIEILQLYWLLHAQDQSLASNWNIGFYRLKVSKWSKPSPTRNTSSYRLKFLKWSKSFLNKNTSCYSLAKPWLPPQKTLTPYYNSWNEQGLTYNRRREQKVSVHTP